MELQQGMSHPNLVINSAFHHAGQFTCHAYLSPLAARERKVVRKAMSVRFWVYVPCIRLANASSLSCVVFLWLLYSPERAHVPRNARFMGAHVRDKIVRGRSR